MVAKKLAAAHDWLNLNAKGHNESNVGDTKLGSMFLFILRNEWS